MNANRDPAVPRCLSCGLSKDRNKPDFAHVRLGLDEPPEPLVCKCKSDSEIIRGCAIRLARVERYVGHDRRTSINRVTSVQLNPYVIRHMSSNPLVEVEVRFSSHVATSMYACVERGVFGHTNESEVAEAGCTAWTGMPMNRIMKLRMRSDGHAVAKVGVYECTIMPGIDIAVSHEYEFVGEILRPDYVTVMDQLTCRTEIEGVSVLVIARKYTCEDVTTFASEIEFEPGVTHADLRSVLNRTVLTVGSECSMRRFINDMYMSEIRYVDHDVVDVKDLRPYKGANRIKVDGMKVYVFSYANGYVVTFANPDLTVLSYTIANRSRPLYEATNKPDVLVAEMMVDGSLVYLDTLAVNGQPVPYSRPHPRTPAHTHLSVNEHTFEIPPMIVNKCWDTFAQMPRNVPTSLPHDGIVCVTEFRTLRLKKPTIDLVCKDGSLYMSENGKMKKVARAHRNMITNAVYEVTVSSSDNENQVVLSHPVRRLIKRSPNNADIVRRAFMSVSTNLDMSTVLYDIQSMSFKMRKRTYELAQANASVTRKVIVIFGAGRFQEINEMDVSNFSYIAIDPEIDVDALSRRAKRLAIRAYDVNAPFSRQVQSITGRGGTLLYYKGLSEDFITMREVATKMCEMGIPAVFSFSISYHIRVINVLASMGVNTFGCGYVHDKMPVDGVSSGPVSMNVTMDKHGSPVMRSKFGKSEWIEPILMMDSVAGLHSIKDELPDVWSNVDASTHAIMSRAVMMH